MATDDGQSLLVSNTGNGTVSEVDTRHWFVKRNLRVGGGPEHMVLSPDNERVYVNDGASGKSLSLGFPEVRCWQDTMLGRNPTAWD